MFFYIFRLIFLCFGKTNKTIYNTENVSNLALVEYMESAVSVKSACHIYAHRLHRCHGFFHVTLTIISVDICEICGRY